MGLLNQGPHLELGTRGMQLGGHLASSPGLGAPPGTWNQGDVKPGALPGTWNHGAVKPGAPHGTWNQGNVKPGAPV
jgi:hypothetical protein